MSGCKRVYTWTDSRKAVKNYHEIVVTVRLESNFGWTGFSASTAVAANRLHGSIQVLLETVQAFSQEMTAEKALAWAA